MWRKGQALWHTFQTVPPNLLFDEEITGCAPQAVVPDAVPGAKEEADVWEKELLTCFWYDNKWLSSEVKLQKKLPFTC